MPDTKNLSVIFDMDGVLVDSEPVINAAAIMGLEEYGIDAKPEDFLPFIGAGEDRYIGGVAQKYGVEYKTQMKDRVYQIYLNIVPSMIKVFKGINELLTKLKTSGFKIALASSADKIKIDANLKAATISTSIFDVIVSGEDVRNKKPSPEIYLHTAELLNQETSNCVVVEDAINGIMAAKSAGMKCIAITTSFDRQTLEKECPDYIMDDISQVYDACCEIVG
ncbi:MAG: HAD-IA family hydrolase [Clostridia bacterium]|nr:HAD-IA family hydrolase [Clostridia bacterium]